MREETYWGWTETLVNTDHYCLKRMWMRGGSQSSLEYHVRKHETYIIEEGVLTVGLRTGRAKNTCVTLPTGSVYHIPPGTMHMRMARDGNVMILEVSTADCPYSDTYIVGDGRAYVHKCEEEG